MDIRNRINQAKNLTPADQAIANAVLTLRDSIDSCTLDDLARISHTSTAAVSRFCNRLGLKGFRAFKVEAARSYARSKSSDDIDVNYPFYKDDTPRIISEGMKALYDVTIADTMGEFDFGELLSAARLINQARNVIIFTHSHNLFVASTFHERLMRIGHMASVPKAEEEQRIVAAASDRDTVAIAISYSGRATFLPGVLKKLRAQKVPVVFISTREGAALHPDLDRYLLLGNKEDAQARISQFASHIALQYTMDVLYGCIFTLDYDKNLAFLHEDDPYVDDRPFV